MATGALGFPAINTPNAIDLRAIQAAIQAARQRIEAIEKATGLTSQAVQQSSVSSGNTLNSLLTQLNALTVRVAALEAAAATDIGTYTAGEVIAFGQGVVPSGTDVVAVADPSDPTRMFGLIGIALNAATSGRPVRVQRRGPLTLLGSPGFILGRAVYVDNDGLTQNPGYEATALPAGVAISTTTVFIAPDWPALLYPTFSSDIADAYLDFLPVTYRAMQDLLTLESQINALSYSSGVDAHGQVPMTIGGIAVRVNAGDIARLLFQASFSSGVDAHALVPVSLNGVVALVNAGDIAALGGSGSGSVTSFSFVDGNGFTGTVLNPTTTPSLSLVFSGTGGITRGDLMAAAILPFTF